MAAIEIDLKAIEAAAERASYEGPGRYRPRNVPPHPDPIGAFHDQATPTAVLVLIRRLRAAEADAKRYQWLKRNEPAFLQAEIDQEIDFLIRDEERRERLGIK